MVCSNDVSNGQEDSLGSKMMLLTQDRLADVGYMIRLTILV
jgi:hypothetical protein